MKPGWKSRSQTWVSPSRHGSHDAAPAAERHRDAVADRPARDRRARPRRPTPQSSCPGTCGRAIDGSWPIQPCQSLRQTPVARTSTTTPSGAQTGSATVSIDQRLREGTHHGGAHRPIVAAVDPLSLPPDELRRLGHYVWDRLVDRWEALDEQPPIAPVDPDFGPQRASRRAPTARPIPQQAIDELFDEILPRGQRADHPRFFARIGSPSNPVSRPRRPDRHRPQHVRRQLDGRRGRLGDRARRARLAARVDGDAGGDRGRPRLRRQRRHAHRARRGGARARRRPRPGDGLRCRSTRTPRSPRRGASSASTRPTCASSRPIPPTGCSPRRSTPRCTSTARPACEPFVVIGTRRHDQHRLRRPAQRPRRPRPPRGPVVPRRRRLRRARPPDAARRGPAGRHRARRQPRAGPAQVALPALRDRRRARPPPGPAAARRSRSTAPTCATPRAASSSSASAARSSPAARAR